ncbi:MAG TPA: ATP-binding protein [Terriglobales bacterium]|nr:ATP-binding protein [Terriglobales bacterium]
MRLKTKLVLGITLLVVALVSVFCYIYVSELLRQRITAAFDTAQLQTQELSDQAASAQPDFYDTKIDMSDPNAVRDAVEEALEEDAVLNTALQSLVGSSRIIYDASIADINNRAILDTNQELVGKVLPDRPRFTTLKNAPFAQQLKLVYRSPEVYDVRIPLNLDGKPFGTARVGVSTIFLKNEIQPQLRHAVFFSGIAIFVSLILAAGLSNIALGPLEALNRRLDSMTAGESTFPEEKERKDEYGLVTLKIAHLGRQMRDTQEVFAALKENLDQIMANLQDGLMLFARDSKAVLVSALAEQFVGRPRGEILGHEVQEIFSPQTRLGEIVLQAFMARRPVVQREVRVEDGRRVQVSLDFIQEGEDQIALLTMRDAESMRRIEDEIELSRRLSAIGRLTSGVAHEVKNPINAIVVHLEVLRQKLQQVDPDTRRHMDVIGSEIQRLDRVVQTLVDFTRPVELQLAETDLRRVLDDVVTLAAPEAKLHGVSVERQLPPEPLYVNVDIDLVKQALVNVVLNGIQAMPNGGTLLVTAVRTDDAIVAEVHDQGAGIPAEIRDKVFNLYFTTKKTGSGIGLARTYRIMQLHHGSIEFDSVDGQGTTFRLRFPPVSTRQEDMKEVATES